MNARWITLACTVILSSLAQAQTPATVQVIATDPASSFELSAREPLYARIAYSSDSPLRFQQAVFWPARK